MHIKESEEIIKVLTQMEAAVTYRAERINWDSVYGQEFFEVFLMANTRLTNTIEVLKDLSKQHKGALMAFVCEYCMLPRKMMSEDYTNPVGDAFCVSCRDDMLAAISITMNKRLKTASTKKED